MARQTINLGTSANKGDGDPLRTAFDKINDNFSELYARDLGSDSGSTVGANLIPDTDGTLDIGSPTKRFGDVYVKDFIYLNSARIEVDTNGVLLVNGSGASQRADVVGDLFGQDSTKTFDSNTNTFFGNFDGNFEGSVFADDSTLLIDAISKTIYKANIEDSANWDAAFAWGNHASAGYISLATLKTEVAASADFADFQTRIAAL